MRFVLIGGFGRSGSSFLQDVLCRHPEIAGGPEFHFTHDIFNLYARMNKDFFLKRNESFYQKDSLKSEFRVFYQQFFKQYSESSNEVKVISEKTPSNYLVVNEFFELFPEGKFIFIYRDGRDAVASYRKVFRADPTRFNKSDYSLINLSRNWNSTIETKNRLLKKYPEKILAVRYENLLQEPDTTVKEITQFLEVDSSVNLFELESPKAFHNDPVFHPESMMKSTVKTKNIGKWKSQLSFSERILINIICGLKLKQEGYHVNSGSILTANFIKKIVG